METALVALVAGAVGAGITGLLQLRRDRVETLRQRQLDAADAFAVAASRVLLSVKFLIDSFPREKMESDIERWDEAAEHLRRSLQEEVRGVAGHTPRIELLFGVKSPASVAALQTTFDLTELATNFQRPVNAEAFRWAYKLGASSALRFHDEANIVVASSWWRRLRHKSLSDETFEAMAADFLDKYGITPDDD